MSAAPHVPVLLEEVVEAVAPRSGALVVDGTFGAGGYSRAFLERGATVVALDRDPGAATYADALAAEAGERFRLAHRRFSELEAEVPAEGAAAVLAAGRARGLAGRDGADDQATHDGCRERDLAPRLVHGCQ